MDEGETDAYEIEVEGSAEYNNVTAAEADAATEADMPKDNGDISGTEESKTSVKKPADDGDAEADEHDLIVMPSMRVVLNDLSGLNSLKCFTAHTLGVNDLLHPTINSLLVSCSDVKLQFSRSSEDEASMLGIMSIAFPTSKQAAAAMSAVKQIRSDLVVESVKPSDTIESVVEKWKKDHSVTNKPVTGAMVIVKNVDSATVTIEKLTELFPDAEDITVSSQPQSSYLGKLKGMKHAYVVFPDQQTADAVVEHAGSNPMELNGRQLIIRHYTEPPNHVPKGYMRLTTRKLVLGQIAHARGLIARAQEDPTYTLPAIWHTRMKIAAELIEKDDEARDILGLPKPSLMDYKEISLKQNLLQMETKSILFQLGIGDDPGDMISTNKTTKRPFPQGAVGSEQAKKATRGGISLRGAKPVPLMTRRLSRGGPRMIAVPPRMMRPMHGAARFDDFEGYAEYESGPPAFPMPSPRLALMAMRRRRGMPMPRDYMAW